MKLNSLFVIFIIILVVIGSFHLLSKKQFEIEENSHDNTAPVINLNSSERLIVVKGEEFVSNATAVDDVDGNITDKIRIDGNLDTNQNGEYELKYHVEDSSGNKSEASQVVEVRDELKNGLPVLMYHFFYSKDDPNYAGKTPDNNLLLVEKFAEQMDYLNEKDYYFPTWQEVSDYIDGKIKLPEKSVALTDDDGNHTFFALAVPVVEEKKIPITSFVITGSYEERLSEKYEYVNYQSHSDKMHAAGSNGKGAMVNWSYNQIVDDLNNSKSKIENATGKTCNIFCYPFGHNNDTAQKALKDTGFDLAFTVEGGRVKPGENKLALPRVRINGNTTINQFAESVK